MTYWTKDKLAATFGEECGAWLSSWLKAHNDNLSDAIPAIVSTLHRALDDNDRGLRDLTLAYRKNQELRREVIRLQSVEVEAEFLRIIVDGHSRRVQQTGGAN